jgi:hypothetical protein
MPKPTSIGQNRFLLQRQLGVDLVFGQFPGQKLAITSLFPDRPAWVAAMRCSTLFV